MKKIILSFFSAVLLILNSTAQTGNVGVGNTSPSAKLDVAGDLALREGTPIAVTGANPAVAVTLTTANPENSFYRITGSPTGIMTLNSIPNGVDGQIITLVNTTTIKLKLTNNDIAGGILTPGALALVVAATGTVTLQYSATSGASRWFVTNSTGSSITDWTKATTTDEPALSTDNQYVTGNVGLGGHTGGAIDNTYNFANNSPAVPLVVVSPGVATAASTPVSTGIRLAQPGTNGTKWPVSADFKLGSYATSGVNAQSQLDIALGNGGTATPDATVMSILGNGNVGIGKVNPANKLHVFGNSSKIIIDNGANATSEIGIEFRNGDASASQPKSAIISKGYNSWKRANMHFVLDGAGDDGPYDLNADTKMIIMAETGNVGIGIGTTAPVRKLEVNNAMKFTNSSSDANDGVIGTAPFEAGLNIVGINSDGTYRKNVIWGGIKQNQNDGGNFFLNNNYFQGVGNIYIGDAGATSNPTILPRNPIGGSNATYLRLGSSSNSLQDLYSNFIYVNNRVHVGGTSPTNYPLFVEGSTSWTGWNRWYDDGYGLSWSGWSSATANVAIYAPQSIMTDNYFIAASDKRIKKDFSISDSKTDLQTINYIQITNYKLIDSISNGNRPFKKVIAQQVEKVYPEAISNTTGFIPNIYTPSVKSELVGNKIILSMGKAHGLKNGDRVKVYDGKGKQIQCGVMVLNDFSFSMESEEIKEAGQYFVFGKEVNDFKTVDYDALAMLNISATQELYKKITALEKENAELKTALVTKADNADIQQLRTQIEELKKIIFNTALKAEK